MKRLIEFAEREELLESSIKGYEYKKLNWIIKINLDGELKGFVSMGKNNKDAVPYKGRSGSNLPPFLLYDKPDFVLGWTSETDKEKIVTRTKARHEAFCELVEECAEKTKEPTVQAVVKFMEGENLAQKVPDDLKDGEWITFQIEETDEKPIDLVAVQEFWKDALLDDEYGEKDYQCIICGEPCSPLTRHKTDIVLPVGGRDRGKLISANDSAYFSYGLKHSLIAPTCSTCEEKYGRALADLLSSDDYEQNRMTFGNLVYLFWTKEKGAPVFMPIVQPKSEDVQELRKKVFAEGNTNMKSFQTSEFYSLALSPNKARVAVRDWEETTLDRVQENVYQFLLRQRVGYEEKYYGIYALAASLFRDANQEMHENVPKLLLKHAILGKPLPDSILYHAVNRCRAEKQVTRTRAGIMRLCLIQNYNEREDYLMTLDKELENDGYQCGRLFAVLEKIQEDANPGINTTMTDKFYGTASTTPGSVFGMLMRNAQSHLSKLRKDSQRRGWAVNHSKRLGEIAQRIEKYPSVLKLKDQSMFSLGYLHQKDDFYKKKSSEEE
ncbi:MAG TPA: type I-C CRISPR-associated protein Cas8c/Csd1 [Bacillales bacterium]|nr:type I-C CRISPR-associated protein Cas8c/Csd1 [Bacillales bacterium]